MKHGVKIVWGSSPNKDQMPDYYEFDSVELLDAFLHGVDEAAGWLDYTVVEMENKPNERITYV